MAQMDHMMNGLHASEGGMYMGHEDTMGQMKDGVSKQHSHAVIRFRPLSSLLSTTRESSWLLMVAHLM